MCCGLKTNRYFSSENDFYKRFSLVFICYILSKKEGKGMEVKFSVYGDRLVFYLSGELDEHYAKGVKEYMESVISKNPKINNVIFNMAGLTFMDSTGIGMLLGRYKRLKKQGVRCFIEQPTVSVEKVIELSGIYEVIPKI